MKSKKKEQVDGMKLNAYTRYRDRLDAAIVDTSDAIKKLVEHRMLLLHECTAEGRDWDSTLFDCTMTEAIEKLGILLAGLVEWQHEDGDGYKKEDDD